MTCNKATNIIWDYVEYSKLRCVQLEVLYQSINRNPKKNNQKSIINDCIKKEK